MEPDLAQVASAVVVAIAPFTPYLVEMGKVGGQRLVEVLAERTGELGWEKAQEIWKKLKERWIDDNELDSAVELVAARTDDEVRKGVLAEVLVTRLKQDPAIADDLIGLLGGQGAVQSILADYSSFVESVTQSMKGSGTQVVRASKGSTIKGVNQTKQ